MKMTNPPDRDRLRKEKLGGTLQPLAAPANVVTLTANIPAELRARRQWVTWRSEPRPGGGKPTKIPYNARSGRRASSTNPQSWSSLDHALAVVSRYDGVGYVFVADDAIVGIDLDGCRNPDTGALTLWAIEIIGATRSYTEISPSGRGLHVFVRGRLPTGRRKRGHVEIYDSGRYFTVTGQRFDEWPMTPDIRPPALGLPVLFSTFLDDPEGEVG